MKTLITLLAIAFSANSFASGSYLDPSDRTTLAPFFGTTILEVSSEGSTDATSSKRKIAKVIIQDSQEFRLSGVATIALAESIKNVQGMSDVSDEEAVDIIVDMAQGLLN